MGDSPQEKTAKNAQKNINAATNEARSLRDQQAADPLAQALFALAGNRAANPTLIGPELLALLDDRAAVQAQQVASQRLAEFAPQLANGPGTRSGAARRAELDVATGLGGTIANAARENRLQAAQLNRAAESEAFNLGSQGLQLSQLPTRDLITAYLGGASTLGQLAGSQPSGTLGGSLIGGLLGPIAGGAGNAIGAKF